MEIESREKKGIPPGDIALEVFVYKKPSTAFNRTSG